jgi:hypothetical protein
MSKEDIQDKAEKKLASKLCKCIKKVDKKSKNESRAISICRNAVIQKKGYEIFRFSCKNKPKLLPKKNTKVNIIRRKKNRTKRLSRKKRS